MTFRNHVAIYAPAAGVLYAGGAGARATGGAELQMVLLARALAKAGLHVAHIVFETDDLPRRVGGVELVVQPTPQGGRGRIQTTVRQIAALQRADAQIYIQRSAGYATGIVGLFARARNRGFVYSASSTADLTFGLPFPPLTAASFRTGLRCADAIVTQTDEQAEAALASLGRTTSRIRSLCESSDTDTRRRDVFLWIGRPQEYKNPMAFVELARDVPQAKFLMVGCDPTAADDGLSGMVARAAQRETNLELRPACPRAEVLQLYRRAIAVVNTSRFEGLPNTFLEGWARGVPSLSLKVDPDGIQRQHRLGLVADGNAKLFAKFAAQLWDERGSSAYGVRAREYVAKHHNPDRIGAEWKALLMHINTNRQASP